MSASDADGDGDSDVNGDGDRILNLVGIGLVVFLAIALGALLLAGSFGSGGDAGDDEAPAVNWTADRVNETHVRLVHDGGPAVQINNLIVVVGKTDRGVRRERWLYSGEGFVVPAQEGATVGLYWKPEEEPIRRVRMARWTEIS
jgi:hypothetical protein